MPRPLFDLDEWRLVTERRGRGAPSLLEAQGAARICRLPA